MSKVYPAKTRNALLLLPTLCLILLLFIWFKLNQSLPKDIYQVEPPHNCPSPDTQSNNQEYPFIGIVSWLNGRQPETYQIDLCVEPTPLPTNTPTPIPQCEEGDWHCEGADLYLCNEYGQFTHVMGNCSGATYYHPQDIDGNYYLDTWDLIFILKNWGTDRISQNGFYGIDDIIAVLKDWGHYTPINTP